MTGHDEEIGESLVLSRHHVTTGGSVACLDSTPTIQTQEDRQSLIGRSISSNCTGTTKAYVRRGKTFMIDHSSEWDGDSKKWMAWAR